jgi:D-serine dehydratase
LKNDKPSDFGALNNIAPLNKGLGAVQSPLDSHGLDQIDWNLLREDLSLPTAVLYRDKLLNNLEWMREFVSHYGAALAPHGKTTMAPKLFQMQMEAGAWGITLATAHQTQVAHAHGVRRVLMANELVGKQNMAAIAELLGDPAFEFYCLVDSAQQVDQLGRFYSAIGLRLNVLVEIGVADGRTGVRDDAQLRSALDALDRWKETILLCGVEVYEGVLHDAASVRAFLQRAIQVTRQLEADGKFRQDPILLSGAGSAWFDVVAEEFSAAEFGRSVQIILRPGCYLTHDVGAYREAQARMRVENPVVRNSSTELVPALHIWAYVQSIPEPEKAIIGMGRRDAAFDSGLPVPALHFRPGKPEPQVAAKHWKITKLMDQHAYLQIHGGEDLRVGDMVAFDICHPCLTFDKWRTLPILDANYQVVDVINTFF